MDSSKAFISVIIPVYNRVTLIQESIASVLILEEVRELLIVDDGSKDGTFELCQHLCDLNPKIKLLHHSGRRNKGVSASRNLGIEKATCEWIAFLDSDDVYLPERFKESAKRINNGECADGYYGFIRHVNLTKNGDGDLAGISKLTKYEDLFLSLLEGKKGYFLIPSILIRKSILRQTQNFDQRLKNCEDTQLWLKASLIGKIVPLHAIEPISLVHQHADNIWNGKTGSYDSIAGHYLMFLYMIDFVLKNGQSDQQNYFFLRMREDYKNYFWTIRQEIYKKWFICVFLPILLYSFIGISRNKVEKFHRRELRKWCIFVINKSIKRII
jgi:glycosyltransferase involved in cell wall biosynthesis